MEPFTIRRVAVKRLRDPQILEFFDAAARRTGNEDITYENGFTEDHGRTMLQASPRTYWLLAKAGLIPVSEREALQQITREGRKIEGRRPPVAKVKRIDPEASIFLMRLQAAHSPRKPVTPPTKARVIKL